MVKFFGTEFFQELAARLNADAKFKELTKDIKTSMLFVIEDQNKAYLLTVTNGNAIAQESGLETPAEFKFIAPYEQWVVTGKGEADMNSLVLKGKMKFKGSLTKILYYQKRLLYITEILKGIPTEF